MIRALELLYALEGEETLFEIGVRQTSYLQHRTRNNACVLARDWARDGIGSGEIDHRHP